MLDNRTKDSRDNIKNESTSSRRQFLSKSVGALTTLSAVKTGIGVTAAESRWTYPIREGTKDETDVHVIESGKTGPTAYVTGGFHGNEVSGYYAADSITNWSIDQGKLVVLPRANPVAIERKTYVNNNGNLNRQFPSGKKPTTPLARAIWNSIDRHNPDTVLALHASKGILWENEGPKGVGQAIYPTLSEGSSEDAAQTAAYLNHYHMPDSFPDYYEFKRGNILDGSRPLLLHKVSADLRIPGSLIEPTKYGTDVKQRVNWHLNIVRHLLRRQGIDRTYS
ncbi:Succinylglutamate desuccinylase / Aspartoacylase family protein [Haladaptatus litoreus]|uniref:Succinylglutamate desuccinylase / Aspartoacylase family protein n=1 Tax=Haladaptatus litoreus TaxID=553468 RepID=A0A1N7DCK7_9EURY|nr:succinylglutamate desuccinylase/aspartoacylase family protein [Haladaptatus litoreus]SIR73556.1 Succinylglutamate desuccinylase / Aspartoacylase family protein [Haladaptatus litoreus]